MDQSVILVFSSFLIIGSFLVGSIGGWFLRDIFMAWYEKADYAKEVIHPEMYDEDGEPANVGDLLYLRIDKDDATIDFEDDDE
jgi:hypothetical protein